MSRVTSSELVLLGLLAETPRHGYDLESVLQARGVREWTSLGFSSIYYVLPKLEQRGWVRSERAGQQQQGRRTYALTEEGRAVCLQGVRDHLSSIEPWHAPVLVGWANSSLLPHDELVAILKERERGVRARRRELRRAQKLRSGSNLIVAAMFDHGLRIIQAELDWIHTVIEALKEAH
jgi:DNA-binding PadR family transcriptional regulator